MKFLLFDREENYIRNLENVTLAKHSEEINGEDVFELEIAGNTDIKKGYKIVYKPKYGYWNEFIVREIEESRTDTLVTRLFCESSFYETLGDFIEDKRPDHSTATGALMVALEPTRWEVGIIDDLGISSTNFYNISSKEAVQKVAETWKGEIRTRTIISGNKITHRYVDLLKQRGNDLGKRFTYTKDLEAVTKTIHRDDVITALYGYGKGEEVGDGYGRRINFADINNGKAYVENNEARLIWGRNNPDGSKSHIFGKVELDDCEDREELKILTEEKLEELSRSLITYEANVIDLKAYGFEHEGVELGDTVGVIDKEFTPDLRLKARVVRVERDLLEDENTIILGNFMPNILDSLNKYEDYINDFRGKQGVWDRSQIISDDGSINAQFLNNLVNELNTRMNSMGGYVYVSDDGKGLTTYDKPIDQNPTMAIQLLGGAFRIANSKLPTGEFNWRTFGDGNGFVADSFVGGLLKGGKVNFDLTNGTLLIGNSTEDYSMYFDGLNLLLGSDVTLSWANVDGKPTIPDDEYITNITKDTVTTTYLKSLNLEVGNEIQMGSNAIITWDNLSEDSKVNLKGEDGRDGIDGTNGRDGVDGSDATVPAYITVNKITQTTIESPDIIGGTVTGGDVYLRNSNGVINAGMSSGGVTPSSVRIWAGDTYVNRYLAPFRVLQNGEVRIGGGQSTPNISISPSGTFKAGMGLSSSGGFEIPYNGDGVYNNFRASESTYTAARWKRDDSTYMYHDPESWSVRMGGTIPLVLNQDSAHWRLKLGVSGSGYNSGVTLKALHHDIRALQVRDGSDSSYIAIQTGDFVTSSSREFKEDIEPMKSALKIVTNTPVYNFKFKGDNRVKAGFIAEESPGEIMTTEGIEEGAISLTDTVGVLWRAIQELDDKVSKSDDVIKFLLGGLING